MTITYQQWSNKLADEWVPTIGEPNRRAPTEQEQLQPGDVTECGHIVVASGLVGDHTIPQGTVWMSERQARAAAYYGWQMTGVVWMHGRDELHRVFK